MTDLFSIVRKIYSVYRRLIYESSTCDSGISIQNQLTNILIYKYTHTVYLIDANAIFSVHV